MSTAIDNALQSDYREIELHDARRDYREHLAMLQSSNLNQASRDAIACTLLRDYRAALRDIDSRYPD